MEFGRSSPRSLGVRRRRRDPGPALSDSHEPYPYSGSATAVSELIEEAGPDDEIVLPWPSQYSFSVESDLGDGISAAPESAFGFEPTFSDPRVHPTGVVISGEPARAVADAEGVHLYYPDPFNSVENGWRRALNSSLRQLGFEPDPPVTYGVVERQSWREGGVPLRNLGRADVPAGWSVVPTPAELSVFACLGLPMRGAVRTAVLTASPDPEDPVIVVSEIVRWPSPRLGEAANKAFRSERASRCVGSAFEAQANQLGLHGRRQRPTSAGSHNRRRPSRRVRGRAEGSEPNSHLRRGPDRS